MMKKAGIITLYYNNNNYGGIAQAYALCKFINNQGINAEMISYKRTPVHALGTKERIKRDGIYVVVKEKLENLPAKIARKIAYKTVSKRQVLFLQAEMQKRVNAFATSREMIPHSVVYDENNIVECTDKYDLFITGSDQVWKPGVLQAPYVFTFLPDDKKRISYASSITVTDLPEDYGSFMKSALSKYDWISVREESAENYLTELLGRKVDTVLDPTLLLDKSEWESITAERQVTDKYMFVYLLGENAYQRKQIARLSKKMGLKIVTLPHVEGKIRPCDIGFGDIQLYDVDLSKFFSLIKYADYVCTDSFHAVVFCNIFETDYWVFEREVLNRKHNMNSRLDTLLNLFEETDRFIPLKVTVPELKKIDFNTAMKKLGTEQERSRNLLKTALS